MDLDLVFFLLASSCLLLLAGAGGAHGHEAMKYPPGVPPPKATDEIRFHEPNQFLHQQQPSGPPGVPPGSYGQQNNHEGANRPAHARHMGGHGEHSFGGKKGVDLEKEREHLKEHTEEKYVDVDQMTESQLLAHYFRTYDLDKDGKLDGLELIKASLKMENEHADSSSDAVLPDIMELVDDVDDQLQHFDENNDGFVSYGEFYRGNRKKKEQQ